jgi:hypothetical protein
VGQHYSISSHSNHLNTPASSSLMKPCTCRHSLYAHSTTKHAPLRTWLVRHGYSVSSNNVNVESSFNHLDNIIRAGGGCRKVSTEVSIQTHLQNVVLPSRQQMISPKTGGRQKWRATQTNLKLVEQSVNATIKSYKGLSLRREILSLSTQLYTYTCRWIVHDIWMKL